MNPTMVISILLGAMLLLCLHFDRRRSERDIRDEENSIAAGFKKWLIGSDASLPPAPAEPATMPEVQKTFLRVNGSIPPELWNRLGTALLSNLPAGAQVTAALDVSFAIDANKTQTVTDNLHYLISELELSGLRIARIEQSKGTVTPVLAEPARRPKKSRGWRIVIRFVDVNPLLQSLLSLSRRLGLARAGQS